MSLIDDQPDPTERLALAVEILKYLPDRHVVVALIDEAVAVRANHERAGQHPLGEHDLRRPGNGERGEPPRLVHQIGGRTDVRTHLDSVAGVTLSAPAP